MAKSKTEVLDKKSKEELKSQIIEEFNTNYKKDIIRDILDDIKSNIDTEYKNQIKNDIKDEISREIKIDIRKDEKKALRRKNFKIFRLSIYIIVLLSFSLFMIYKLYITDNLTIISSKLTLPVKEKEFSLKDKTTQITKDNNYYIDKYSYLLNNININNDLIKNDIEVDDISIQDKLVIAYSSLGEEKINVDGDIITISEDVLQNKFNSIFGSDSYKKSSFSVYGLNFAYSSAVDSYIAIGKLKSINYINNYIVDVIESGNSVVFNTGSYIIKDDDIYNVDNIKITNYDKDTDISKIINKLSHYEYTFINIDGNYYLKSIKKK